MTPAEWADETKARVGRASSEGYTDYGDVIASVIREAQQEERQRVNQAWLSALHKNDVVDVKDADGSNGKFLLAIVQEELAKIHESNER